MPFIYVLPTTFVLVCAFSIGAVVLHLCGGRAHVDFLRILFWGLGIGCVSFLTGFVGPVYLTPQANQGPLFGIFMSGPAGSLVGCVVGAARSIYLVRRQATQKA